MKAVVWSSLANLRVAEIAEMVAEYAGEHSAIHYISEFNVKSTKQLHTSDTLV